MTAPLRQRDRSSWGRTAIRRMIGTLRHVNEEISAYYELSFSPAIQSYDGSFRKITVNANRKDLVIHSRTGYFALRDGNGPRRDDA